MLRAVGLTRRQAAASAALAPGLAAAAGATLGVAAAIIASNWMPIGAASLAEPSPGISADWLVLGAGWAACRAARAGRDGGHRVDRLAGRARPPSPAGPRRSRPGPGRVCRCAAIVGARFALEPGRGRAAVPVRPAIAGAVAGVLGVLAALTFSAGISDAVANPARFGQTWQLDDLLRRGRPGLRPGERGVPCRGGRPRRHRVPRRAHRRRPVGPRLDRELHLRPGGRQARCPWC